MKNKSVGCIIVFLGVIVGLITYMFNIALSKLVASSCSHGVECPMWGTISFQTNVSLLTMFFIIGIGFYLILENTFQTIQKKKIKSKKKSPIRKKPPKKYILDKDEKKVLQTITKADGTLFQSQIVEETDFTKTKVTRVLDKLEGKGLIERKRRGMTNVVILKR